MSFVTIPQSAGGAPFAVRRFSSSDRSAVRRFADGQAGGFGSSVVFGPILPAPVVRFNRRQVRRQAVRVEIERRAQAQANRAEMERRAGGRFAVPAVPVDVRTVPDPAEDTGKDRNEWRAVHGRRTVQPIRQAGFIEPSEFGGLLVDDGNVSILIRTDSAGSDAEGWDVTAPVRRFFQRRTKQAQRADGPAPCLVFDVLTCGANGAIVRVDGPALEVSRYFGPSFVWPEWCREVSGRDTARVLQAPLPTERIESGTAVNQSEVKRDRFARMPGQASPRVRQAVRYKRAGQWERARMAPDGPRPVLG